jgi:cell division protein FtsL
MAGDGGVNRRVTLVAAIIMSVCSFALYQTELGVRRQENQLTALDRQIDQHQRAIRVLQAEWAYLSQPTRLQDLAFRHLSLVPVSGDQMGRIEDLPVLEASMSRSGVIEEGRSENPTWPGSGEALPLPLQRPQHRSGIVMTSHERRQ